MGRDTEFTVTRWVGVGHAQARASHELQGALAGTIVTIPALYMAGDRDLVVSFPGTEVNRMTRDARTYLIPAINRLFPVLPRISRALRRQVRWCM